MKSNSKSNILITTALTETWGNQDQKAILLGEWCKTLDNQKDLELRDYQQIPCHWGDGDKFIKDYDYLELFYERVLQSLTNSLNDYHGVDRSLRYWRMLLGPWLLTYVAIAWDRWESLRLAFAEQDFDEVHCLNLNRDLMVPKDYNRFDTLWTDDHWNHHLFTEIIRYHYADQLSIHNLDQDNDIDINSRSTLIKKAESTRSRTLRFLDKCFGLLQRHYKVVFVESFFDRVALFQLSTKLRQLPRIHNEFFQSIHYPKVNQGRYHRSIDVQPTTDFEEFFQQHVFSQIPIAYLEGYAELNRVAASIKTTGDVIFTANAHLDNDLFNCWAGDQVEQGKKLVVSQHGGAIHLMQMFEHQERITETVTVWHKPYMNKHVQLTPNKLISGFRESFYARYQTAKGNDLTLVGLETSSYTYRAQAGPFGRNYTEDYNQKITFAKSLSSTTYDLLRIRSFSRGDGWIKSKDRYARDLGQDKISTYPTLREAFAHSKLIVCTYPQTTFIEAMHSNVPTILLYCEEHWPMHPQFDDLIEDLKTNNIIFTDPIKAAEHINAVWNDPAEWWLDAETQKAVNHFFEMCGKVSDDWVDEWTDFFQSAYSQSIKTSSYIETSERDGGGSVLSKIKIFFVNFIKKSIQGLFVPLARTRMGRVIIELVINDLMNNTRKHVHNDIELKFIENNSLTKFRIDTFSTKEPETLDWIDSFDKNTVLWDIGSNIGLYSIYAAKKKNCSVIAFEPSVFNLELLARNVWVNNLSDLITIIPLPLTEYIKTSSLKMTSTEWGGALSTFGEDYGSDGEELSTSFEYKIMGLSMEDAAEKFDLPKPNHIKIDVDGIEHLVLKGGRSILQQAETVLIEINDAFEEQAHQSNKYLEKSGFKLKEKRHAEYYDRFDGIESSTYNQIWIKK